MNRPVRRLAWLMESAVYGPIYSAAKYRIRSPVPLDPEENWAALTRDLPPFLRWLRDHHPPAPLRRAYVNAKFKLDHWVGISHFYDTSNAFHELFLDKKYMFYSCADFLTGNETLDEAQENKANFLLHLISPKEGERILDLGCGWGGMLKRIRAVTGDQDNLFGYTLSREQIAYNEQHNGFRVEFKDFITADYPREHFDKIYSIGAWEHVRPHEIPVVLAKLFRALKPGGRLVQQFICFPSDKLPACAVGAQIYFPGSVLASYRYQLRSAEAAGFRVIGQTIHDYRDTLRAWYWNLVANRVRAIELVGVHTYNAYLVFFPSAWRFHHDMEGFVLRLALQKPVRADTIPVS